MLCPQEEAGVGRGLVTEGLFSLFCTLPQSGRNVGRGAFTGQQAEVGGQRARACFPAALGEALRLSHAAPAPYLSFPP